MSNSLIQASEYQKLLAENGLTQNVKHFEGMYTPIAISEGGHIAIYFPYVPAVKGGFLKEGTPEQPEKMEVLHISQINDFDIDLEGEEETSVSSGLGGALIGGFLGGATGAIIGSAATSGNVKSTTTITGANLVINTNDFNNPRIEVRLYSRFDPPNKSRGNMRTPIPQLPLTLQSHYKSSGMGYFVFDKEGYELAKNIFCMGEPNVAQIEDLQSTLTQMLMAQQVTKATPQISYADELAKFKSLLDSGAITQEEYEQKKRQLLGL